MPTLCHPPSQVNRAQARNVQWAPPMVNAKSTKVNRQAGEGAPITKSELAALRLDTPYWRLPADPKARALAIYEIIEERRRYPKLARQHENEIALLEGYAELVALDKATYERAPEVLVKNEATWNKFLEDMVDRIETLSDLCKQPCENGFDRESMEISDCECDACEEGRAYHRDWLNWGEAKAKERDAPWSKAPVSLKEKLANARRERRAKLVAKNPTLAKLDAARRERRAKLDAARRERRAKFLAANPTLAKRRGGFQ